LTTQAQSPALDFESLLNPDQRPAVTHGEGPQLVLAGAGSGKTRVITYRVAWLIHERGIDPAHIVAVTFTNKAAAEMRHRIEDLVGLEPLPSFVGTFHRYALRLLRRYGERVGLARDFVIFDSDDQLGLIKSALKDAGLSEAAFTPRAVLSAISSAKNRLLTPTLYEAQASGYFERQVAKIYPAYQGKLAQASGVDFDDMLKLSVELLGGHPEIRERVRHQTDYLLVDEFQDTNHAQLRMVLEIIGNTGNITAVGDEDQGIYRWRGADLDNVLAFEKSFPGAVVRKLERNYRSTQNILTASGEIVARNRKRRGKRLWTDSGDGAKIEIFHAGDEKDEARWVVRTLRGLQSRFKPADMGVLVRTNAQTRAIEEELLRVQMPYVLVGGVRFYQRAEIKDLIAYLRLLRRPWDNYSLLRILNRPARAIGKATQDLLVRTAEEVDTRLWDILVNDQMGSFPARSANALRAFRDLIVDLRSQSEELPLPALLDRLIARSGYAEQFKKKKDDESQARLENIREFLSAAQDYTERHRDDEAADLLAGFLDHVALVSDLDGWEGDRGVSLMTLHSAKGLEFSAVVLPGLEDGLLPHFNAGEHADDIEEERRLLYVGMTRAKKRLFLSSCRRRRIAGYYQDRRASPFLDLIPEETSVTTDSPEILRPTTSSAYSFFRRGGRSAAAAPRPAPERLGSRGGLGKGSRVCHATLGRGVVLDVEGDGDALKVVVFFDRNGKRKLVAKHANLEVL